jgi:hypothetical protein
LIKKTITYEDFNGDEVTEDFYFHLTQAEVVELELSEEGGMYESLQRMAAAEDGAGVLKEIKKMLLAAYGVRSPDGRKFVKNDELRAHFATTNAYSKLFMGMLTNTDEAIEFFNALTPPGLEEAAAKLAGIDTAQTPIIAVVTETEEPEEKTEPKRISRQELHAMGQEELKELGVKLASGEVVVEDIAP